MKGILRGAACVVGATHVAHSRRARWVRACLAALVVGIPASIGSFASPSAAAAASAPHIMLIVEENQGYNQIIGNNSDPYINSLASKYASATKWYGMTDSSLGDYVALIAGTISTRGSSTLVGELADTGSVGGITWNACRRPATPGREWATIRRYMTHSSTSRASRRIQRNAIALFH